MEKIEQNIYFEDSYPGVTIGALVFSDGTIMIDAPLHSEDARSWRATLLNMGSSTKRFLVNLDAHPDRTLGTRALECPIIAHQDAALEFEKRPSIFKGQRLESGAEWEIASEVVGTRWAAPNITLTEQMQFHLGNAEIFLEHHPGPSPGSIWVIIPSASVVFIGDAILLDQPPFLISADLPAWIETLDLLRTRYRNYLIVSGRSGLVAIESVLAQKRLLKRIMRGFNRLANRNAPPEKTEGLIKGLLKNIPATSRRKTQYTQRLRHGLFHYYAKHYHPTKTIDPD